MPLRLFTMNSAQKSVHSFLPPCLLEHLSSNGIPAHAYCIAYATSRFVHVYNTCWQRRACLALRNVHCIQTTPTCIHQVFGVWIAYACNSYLLHCTCLSRQPKQPDKRSKHMRTKDEHIFNTIKQTDNTFVHTCMWFPLVRRSASTGSKNFTFGTSLQGSGLQNKAKCCESRYGSLSTLR